MSGDFDDFISGSESGLIPEWIYGDQCGFSAFLKMRLANPGEFSGAFERLLKDGLVDDKNQAFLSGLQDTLDAVKAYRQHRTAIESGQAKEEISLVKQHLSGASASFDECYGGFPFSGNRAQNSEQPNILNLMPQPSAGYWLLYNLLQSAGLVTNAPTIAGSAQTAILVSDTTREPKTGYVLWLTVDLYRNNPGTFVPDLLPLGLTDVSPWQEPMTEVWKAAGVADEYSGIWRINSHYSGTNPRFLPHKPKVCLPHLSGRSFQVAALTAIWTATNRIPLGNEDGSHQMDSDSGERDYFELPKYRLTLNPAVVVSAALDPATTMYQNNSIKMAPIADDSILPKVEAANNYSATGDNTPFDSVIVFGTNAQKVREQFSPDDERNADYRGIRIITDFETVGNAIDWMLEVNAWKAAWNKKNEKEWLELWGFARNEDRHLVDINNKPILTGEGKPTENPEELEGGETHPDLINTGSLEYMRRPIGGANELDSPAEQASDIA